MSIQPIGLKIVPGKEDLEAEMARPTRFERVAFAFGGRRF